MSGHVRLGRRITEDDMIAAFLAAEIDSRRFGARVREVARAAGLDEASIRDRATDDPETNARRRLVLERYRGWGQDESVFGGLPTETIDWWSAELARDGLVSVDVINYMLEIDPLLTTRHLLELSDASADAADEADIAAVVDIIKSGGTFVEPIVIAEPELERLVILEGHTRMSAYAALRSAAPDPIALIVGVTSEARRWSEW